MLQDIFTNIFIQADIKTACNLRLLCNQTYAYCDTYVLSLKLKQPIIFDNFTDWLLVYHNDYVKYHYPSKYNYDEAITQANYILTLAKSINNNIYVRISIRNHLIYKLLGINKRNFNTITFHINTNVISFRMLKLCELTKTLYYDNTIECTDNAFLHYLTVILYDHKYDKIINHRQQHFLPCDYAPDIQP